MHKYSAGETLQPQRSWPVRLLLATVLCLAVSSGVALAEDVTQSDDAPQVTASEEVASSDQDEATATDQTEVSPSNPDEAKSPDQELASLADKDAAWNVSYEAVRNTTTGTVGVDPALISEGAFDQAQVTATMSYKSATVREVKTTLAASDFDAEGKATVDFKDYGKFSLSVTFLKDGATVGQAAPQTIGVVADTYNISPVSATLPVTFFSLHLWGDNNIRESGPVILMMERPAAYDWDALPSNVYGLPFLSDAELRYQPGDFNAAGEAFREHQQIMADYVHDLMEVSPDSTYNLYCVDVYLNLVHRVIYANRIPEDQYTIKLLSDGTFTAARVASIYGGSNPAATHERLVSEWEQHKANAYKNGVIDADIVNNCSQYLWAMVDSEPNAELWVARKDLLKTTGDGNAFGQQMQANPKLVQVNIGNLLAQNIKSSETNTAEFKALYNFNDSFFAEAEAQGKDAMVFLGTRVTTEPTFVNYARFVMSYYGDSYVYYYKGHPGTPTDLYPEKVSQLESLGIIDVDSSIAAELILFFNPEIYLSGYSSSTYASVPVGMGKGMFNMTRAAGLANAAYENMDFWMSQVTDATDKRARVLCAAGHESYLVEFSDKVAEDKGYTPAGETGTRYIAIWDATTSEIVYYRLNDDETAYELVDRSAGIDIKSNIEDGTYVIESVMANDKVLDVKGGSKANSANVQLYTYNASNAQKWKVTVDDDGLATIVNVGSGKALDVRGAKAAKGTNVQQYAANSTLAQKWIVTKDNGAYRILSALDPKFALDIAGGKQANGTNIQIYQDNGSKAQRFRLLNVAPKITPDGQAEIEEGYYLVGSALNSSLVLAPAKWDDKNGTNAQLANARNTSLQTFKITKLDSGFYSLTSAFSGMSLDLSDGKIIPGTNVQLWAPAEGNTNQQWKIVEHTGGSFTIQNVRTGLVLDVAGGKGASGTNVCGYVANGTQAQRWLLRKAAAPHQDVADIAQDNKDVLADGTYVIHSTARNRLVLDVAGGSTANKANVRLWTANGSDAQKWIVSHDKNGFLSIVNKKSRKALDIAGGKRISGTNVWQYAENGSAAQKWIAVETPSDGYELVSAVSSYLVLDVAGGSTERGANLQVFVGNGTQAQHFTFEKVK